MATIKTLKDALKHVEQMETYTAISLLRALIASLEKQEVATGSKIDQLKVDLHKYELENAKLRTALLGVIPWVVTQSVACGGMKCRENVCISCSGEDDAEESAQIALNAYTTATAALKEERYD